MGEPARNELLLVTKVPKLGSAASRHIHAPGSHDQGPVSYSFHPPWSLSSPGLLGGALSHRPCPSIPPGAAEPRVASADVSTPLKSLGGGGGSASCVKLARASWGRQSRRRPAAARACSDTTSEVPRHRGPRPGCSSSILTEVPRTQIRGRPFPAAWSNPLATPTRGKRAGSAATCRGPAAGPDPRAGEELPRGADPLAGEGAPLGRKTAPLLGGRGAPRTQGGPTSCAGRDKQAHLQAQASTLRGDVV